jgi:stress response protein SCP2
MPSVFKHGIRIPDGKTVKVPSAALKPGGEMWIGSLADLKAGSNVDMEFACAVYAADGTRIDYANYKRQNTNDGSCQHQGDASGENPEYIKVSMDKLGDNVQAIIFCIYAYTDGATFKSLDGIKLVAKAGKAGDRSKTSLGYKQVDVDRDVKGCTAMAIWKDGSDWKISTLDSVGQGPTVDDMEGACKEVFGKVGVAK